MMMVPCSRKMPVKIEIRDDFLLMIKVRTEPRMEPSVLP